ncbi:PorT family protein [Spirosoma sp. KCTC 42546]|uniref:porin family protein n=1 Tax=Spirosoma sp. KCTC 42546 TaxID=2520506 RepID=UPI00115ABB83|nr:porin family protein [Spirosoma sp. KCTC 42546]QDK82209.1 PorT family protein [Spirosoma sp. KCTC 42546]
MKPGNHSILIVSLIGLLLLLVTQSMAQSAGKKIHVGLKAGANFSQLDNLSFSTPRLMENGLPVLSGGHVVYDFFEQNQSRSTGIVGGVFVRFGNRFFIQPELLLSSKGGQFDIIRQGLETQSVRVRVTTFDLPLLIGVKLGPLRINVGPVVSLPLSETNSLSDSFQRYAAQSLSQTAKQAVYGYQAGIGVNLGGIQLDLRQEGSLNTIFPVTLKDPANDSRFSSKTNVWQLTAGFSF